MAITRIGNPAIADVRGVNFRNIIINGDMSVSQRSTSKSTSSTGYHTIDRWNWQADYGTVTLSQSTDVPTGQGFAKSFKADVTTAGTVGSGGTVVLRQKVEGQNLQYLKKGTSSAESLTCSFWIKSTKTGTYICELFDADNTRQISKAYTVSASDTWEKKIITFAGDTSGAFDNDNANSLQINWYLSAGSDYTSGTLSTTWTASTNANRAVGQVDAQDNTSNNIYLTGVQLEAGTTASDFEFLPVDCNLQRCKRYTHRINGNATNDTVVATCSMASTSQVRSPFMFPVTMRTSPSVTESDLEIQDDANSDTASSLGLTFGACDSSIALVINADSSSPFSSGESGLVKINNTTSGFLMFDAEL